PASTTASRRSTGWAWGWEWGSKVTGSILAPAAERGHDPVGVPSDQALVRVDRRVAEGVVVEVALDGDARLLGDRPGEVRVDLALVDARLRPGRLERADERRDPPCRRILAGHADDRADDLEPV